MRGVITEQVDDEGTFKYSIEDLHKLRSSTTDGEKATFLWFAGDFVETVAGRKTWGKQKYLKLMTEGTREGEKGLVSVSDEAFALLMLDNYQERWIKEKMEKKDKGNGGVQQDKTVVRGRKGKYTAPKMGNREFRGWSNEGILEYGRLLKMVRNDRRLHKEENTLEKWVRQQLRMSRKVGDGSDKDNGGDDADSMGDREDVEMFNESDYDE